jgi:hypothetical protein
LEAIFIKEYSALKGRGQPTTHPTCLTVSLTLNSFLPTDTMGLHSTRARDLRKVGDLGIHVMHMCLAPFVEQVICVLCSMLPPLRGQGDRLLEPTVEIQATPNTAAPVQPSQKSLPKEQNGKDPKSIHTQAG